LTIYLRGCVMTMLTDLRGLLTQSYLCLETRQFLEAKFQELLVSPAILERLLMNIPIEHEYLRNNKIPFIKWVRTHTDLGLQAAKNLIEKTLEI
jgi:hypothetical protein